jgi:hypothetical protein
LGEKILIGLCLVAAVAVVCGVSAYNTLDKLRFFLKRTFQKAQDELDSWVLACEKIKPGCGQKYFSTKNFMEKSAYICEIIESVSEDTEEKLNIQESLLDFCLHYRQMAKLYNEKLKKPILRQVAKLFRFKPCPIIDFYAHEKTGKPFGLGSVSQ